MNANKFNPSISFNVFEKFQLNFLLTYSMVQSPSWEAN